MKRSLNALKYQMSNASRRVCDSHQAIGLEMRCIIVLIDIPRHSNTAFADLTVMCFHFEESGLFKENLCNI